MVGKRLFSASKRMRLKVLVMCLMLLGLLPLSGLGQMYASRVAADPDLCALLPTGPKYTVSSTDRTQYCKATSTDADIRKVEITKFNSPDAAHSALATEMSASGGRWDASTRYGDAGYGFERQPFNLDYPGGAFARGCYMVFGEAWRYPSIAEVMYSQLVYMDLQLKANPCGATALPTATTDPSTNTVWRVRVDRVVNAQWFGVDPPQLKRKDGSVIEIKEGMVLEDDIGTLTTRGFRVYLSWNDQYSSQPWKVTLGPDSQVDIGRRIPKGEPTPKLVRFMEISRGFAAFFFPKGEPESEFKFQASSHTVVAAIKGTTFNMGYDEKSQATTIQLTEGTLQLTPLVLALPAFQLNAGQQVRIDLKGVGPITPYVPIPGEPGRVAPETGHAINGIFLDYWNTHGGLAQQGYPLSDEMQEKSDLNGQTYTVQYFERAVFEHHPEYQPPNNVLLSQLGTFQYKRKYPNGAPNQRPNQTNGKLFTETNHWVGGKFYAYWQSHGGLAQQGLPLSDEFTEISETNGKPYTVQYFERAVFEDHPENSPPNDVLLSLLGAFQYGQKYGGGGGSGGTGNPPPAATSTPTSGGGNPNCSQTTNIALLTNGGSIVAASSDYGGGYRPTNMIDGNPNSGWSTGQGLKTNQYIIVALPGNQTYTINKVRLNGYTSANDSYANDSIQDFEIRVSTTNFEVGSFRTVFAGNTPKQNAFFDYTFPAVQARYVMLFVVRNYGGDFTEAREFEIYQSCTGGGNPPPPPPPPAATATTAAGGGGDCSGIPANQNMTVSPSNCARAGSSFYFEATGFNPNENVGAYATAPDGSVFGANFQLVADANGNIRSPNGVTLTTQTGTPPGIYALTMEGVTSHRKAIGYIKLLAP